jgi:NAD(P)-dependent dehydrogenase (short-subunit alcohol dehydrogenase family)
MDCFAGKVALVTGGTSGIGAAVAAHLARKRARVVIAGRNQQRGDRAAYSLTREGFDVSFVQTDVSYEADVKWLVHQTVATCGGIDYLFNNAGIEGVVGTMAINTEESVDEILAVNVKGVFLCMKHAIPRMIDRGGGVVVNTASFTGTTRPAPDRVIYGASKAAVLSMTRSVAAGLVNQNVRVFAVCPCTADTPMTDRLADHQPHAKGQLAALNPSGRLTPPEDVAGVAVAFFAGTTRFESGDAVMVDSGGAMQKVRGITTSGLTIVSRSGHPPGGMFTRSFHLQ